MFDLPVQLWQNFRQAEVNYHVMFCRRTSQSFEIDASQKLMTGNLSNRRRDNINAFLAYFSRGQCQPWWSDLNSKPMRWSGSRCSHLLHGSTAGCSTIRYIFQERLSRSKIEPQRRSRMQVTNDIWVHTVALSALRGHETFCLRHIRPVASVSLVIIQYQKSWQFAQLLLCLLQANARHISKISRYMMLTKEFSLSVIKDTQDRLLFERFYSICLEMQKGPIT